MSADTLVPGAGGQALNRYMYVGGNPLRYTDPTGHLGDDEIAQVLGFESAQQMYESDLWKAWTNGSTGDPYWLAVLRAIHAGDRLQASGYAGVLAFGKNDVGVMQASTLAGAMSANLWDWQGRGFYTIDRPGTSEREDAVFSDRVYQSTAANYPLAFAYTTYRFPQYAYSEDPSGGISASFSGFQYIDRYMTVQWDSTFVQEMTGWDYAAGVDWLINIALLFGGTPFGPGVSVPLAIAGIIKSGLDCSAIAGVSLFEPVYYYRVVPPGTVINPFNFLR